MLWIPNDINDIVVLVLAVLLDLVVGELPNKFHPTAWMGKTVTLVEKLAPRNATGQLVFGICMALVIPGFWAAAAYLAVQGLRDLDDLAYLLVGAALLKTTFSVKMLRQAAAKIQKSLIHGDLMQARAGLSSLVSRNVSTLTSEQATAATVESVSENTTDSFVGPWLAFALFGLPGAFAYRAINTLDSMIGYHGRYEYLGKASAKLDDLVNLIPARLTALVLVLSSALLPGQRAGNAWRIMWRDHGRTESPNAGWTMSGMAGALGVELEKVGFYRLGDQTRPLEPRDIDRAIRTMGLVAGLSLLIALGIIFLRAALF